METREEALEPWAQAGRQPRIAIVGAGMSGIAAVVKLRKAGYTDLVVFEKGDRVGGTWRENTYPGLSCDVPSAWYSFSFALNPDWNYRYSYGPEIQAYMEKTASDFGVTDVVRFNTGVSDLVYDAPCWRLTTTRGETLEYDIVISAAGVLHRPAYPDIEGLDTFAGTRFHSARWDHSVDLSGKRVGVIGTGSTATQIIAEITKRVGHMFVFQRTAQWMTPMLQKKYSEPYKRLLRRVPILRRFAYYWHFLLIGSIIANATTGNKFLQGVISKSCKRNLEENVSDPELRAKLTPNYQAACKRLVFCSEFYPAISRDNAHLITEGIERITPEGIQTEDGALHELDVLVFATGFDPTSFILPTKVTGEDGADLATLWDGAPRAHRGVAMPGFPNFWMIEGPTSPVGNLSLITISENQVDYVIAMIDRMRDEGLAAIAPRIDAYVRYNDAMRVAIKKTVWVTGGCNSWYIDKSGLPNLYPWKPMQYLREMQQPVYDEYRLIRDVAESAGLRAA
jgi:cation diffusion facilitator CzcD-associated flavoprotein CzcO